MWRTRPTRVIAAAHESWLVRLKSERDTSYVTLVIIGTVPSSSLLFVFVSFFSRLTPTTRTYENAKRVSLFVGTNFDFVCFSANRRAATVKNLEGLAPRSLHLCSQLCQYFRSSVYNVQDSLQSHELILAGPQNGVRGRQKKKVWISIFMCFKTRAIHIEAVEDLSTGAFLAAFRFKIYLKERDVQSGMK